MSTENQTATKRVITIYSTKGAKKAKIETEATTWAELKPLISKAGYDLNSLHATENVNKTDLVNEAAVLPTTEFTVFLRPKQTKSGAGRADGLAYKDIRNMIKGDIESYPDAGKEHYNQGKNYTAKSTDELRDLANSFVAPTGNAEVKKEKPAKVEKVSAEHIEETTVIEMTNADHVENIKHDLKCIIENASSEDVKERAKELLEDFLPGLEAEVANDSEAKTTKVETTNIADVVKSVADSKESAEEEGRRIAREKAEQEEAEKIAKEKAEEEARKKAEKEEDERLAAEAKSLGL